MENKTFAEKYGSHIYAFALGIGFILVIEAIFYGLSL